MSRCVCGHSEEAHFAMVKEGYDLRDAACCAGNCACGCYRTEWDNDDVLSDDSMCQQEPEVGP